MTVVVHSCHNEYEDAGEEDTHYDKDDNEDYDGDYCSSRLNHLLKNILAPPSLTCSSQLRSKINMSCSINHSTVSASTQLQVLYFNF